LNGAAVLTMSWRQRWRVTAAALWVVGAAVAIFLPQAALTQAPLARPDAVPGLRVALGDTMDKVRAAYAVRGEPIVSCLEPCLMLWARSDGLRFFFKKDDKLLYEIRADAPFTGSIAGVRLGDSLDAVVAKLGAPLGQPWEFDGLMAYLFDADPHRLRCDVGHDNRCATIFYWAGPFTS
jgi:hypothetical protein